MEGTLGEITPGQRAYRPYGAALQLMYCKDQEVLLGGPAGTGKSRAMLEKLHLMAEKYPGMRGLILRKTRESLTQSALVTYEQHVLPEGHPVLRGPQRNMRQSYKYPNGSEIVVGGLDKSEKVMSTEYDVAYVQEAIEIEEKDWENVSSRLRNHRIPYQQIIADTNPSAASHWLYRRCLEGKCTLFESIHEHNPVLYDMERREYTLAGKIYLGRLDQLTGVRYQRLRLGKWVSAEGMIYENFDRSKVMMNKFKVPWDWPRIWCVDFGFTNPFTWQNWVISPNDVMIMIQEIYVTKMTVEDICPMIIDATKGQPKPKAVVCDHDAEDRATLKKHLNISNSAAYKGISVGIQGVISRFKLREDGNPGIRIFHDALTHPPDEELVEARKPTCFVDEIEGYVWDTSKGKKKGEQPIDTNNHGCDTARYAVAFVDKLGGGGTSLVSKNTNVRIPTQEEAKALEDCYGWKNALRRRGRARA